MESKTRPKIEKLENLPEKELDVLIYDQYMCDVTHVFVALTTTGKITQQSLFLFFSTFVDCCHYF